MERTKNNDTEITLEILHPNELDLIRKIRKNMRFGEITIMVRDGLPVRLKRITEVEELGKLDTR